MLKQFIRDSVIYTSSALLSKGLSIFLLPLYTRFLSPSQLGILDLFTVATVLINITVALEISQGIARYYADQSTDSERARYASTALWFTVLMFLLFIVICFLFTKQLSLWLTASEDNILLIQFFLINLLFKCVFYISTNQLRWMLKARDSAISGFIYSLITVSLSALLLIVFKWNLDGIITAEIFGAICGSIYAVTTIGNIYRFQVDLSALKKMLSFSIPLVPSSISVFVSLYCDRIIIKEYLSLKQVAIYGVAIKFAMIVTLLTFGFQKSLTPLIYKRYRFSDTPAVISNLFNLYIFFSLSFVSGLVIFAREILMIFTTSIYYSAQTVIPILASATFLSQMYIFAPGLGIVQKTGIIAMINIFGATINLALNLVLIPPFGITGAGLATLVASFTSLVCSMSYSQRYYYIPYKWRRIILGTVPTVMIILYASKLSGMTHLSLIYSLIKSTIFILICIITAYILIVSAKKNTESVSP